MALQLAWGRTHGAPVACYETAHLRIFKNARTETCRSTSAESKARKKKKKKKNGLYFLKTLQAWVDSMLSNQTPIARKKLFSQALEAQKNYMMDCIKAKGCDRHLMGLRILAMGKGGPPPG